MFAVNSRRRRRKRADEMYIGQDFIMYIGQDLITSDYLDMVAEPRFKGLEKYISKEYMRKLALDYLICCYEYSRQSIEKKSENDIHENEKT